MVRYILILITIILLALLLAGCSTQKRAIRYISKAHRLAPELFDSTTTIREESLFIPMTPSDTIVKFKRDTVVQFMIMGEGQSEIKIKYKYITETDSIFIEGECPPKEVVTVTKTVTVPPIVLKPTFWQQFKWVLLIAFLVAVFAFLRRRR